MSNTPTADAYETFPSVRKTDADLDAMDLDTLDRYHDALLSCIEMADHCMYSATPYREEAARVAIRLKAAGWAT